MPGRREVGCPCPPTHTARQGNRARAPPASPVSARLLGVWCRVFCPVAYYGSEGAGRVSPFEASVSLFMSLEPLQLTQSFETPGPVAFSCLRVAFRVPGTLGAGSPGRPTSPGGSGCWPSSGEGEGDCVGLRSSRTESGGTAASCELPIPFPLFRDPVPGLRGPQHPQLGTLNHSLCHLELCSAVVKPFIYSINIWNAYGGQALFQERERE